MTDPNQRTNRSFLTLLNILQSSNCLNEAQSKHNATPSLFSSSSSPVAMTCPYTEDDQLMQALSPKKNRPLSMNALYQAAASVKTPSPEDVSRCLNYAIRNSDVSSASAASAGTISTPSSDDVSPLLKGPSKVKAGVTSLDTDRLRGITQKPSGRWVSDGSREHSVLSASSVFSHVHNVDLHR